MHNHVRRVRATVFRLRPLSRCVSTARALKAQIELREQALREIRLIQHDLKRLLHNGSGKFQNGKANAPLAGLRNRRERPPHRPIPPPGPSRPSRPSPRYIFHWAESQSTDPVPPHRGADRRLSPNAEIIGCDRQIIPPIKGCIAVINLSLGLRNPNSTRSGTTCRFNFATIGRGNMIWYIAILIWIDAIPFLGVTKPARAMFHPLSRLRATIRKLRPLPAPIRTARGLKIEIDLRRRALRDLRLLRIRLRRLLWKRAGPPPMSGLRSAHTRSVRASQENRRSRSKQRKAAYSKHKIFSGRTKKEPTGGWDKGPILVLLRFHSTFGIPFLNAENYLNNLRIGNLINRIIN